MARFVQLQVLMRKVRLDLGDDPNASKGRFTDEIIARALNRVQNVLWHSYEWPFRLRQWHIPLMKGQRFYELPDDVDFDGISEVLVRWNDNYLPVLYGYSNAIWNSRDPHKGKGERSDPIQYYRMHEPIEGRTRSLMEVWPVPTMSGELSTDPTISIPVPDKDIEDDTVKFDGNNLIVLRAGRRLPEMLSDKDTCYLDEEILIAFTVAELAMRRQLPDAQLRLQYAQEMVKRVRATGSKLDSFSLSDRAKPRTGVLRTKFGPRARDTGTP